MLFAPLALALALASPASPSAPSRAAEDAIEWFQGPYFSALAKAKAENRLVFVAFCTQTSTWCEKLDLDTFSDAAVAAELADVVCLRVDVTRDASNQLVDPSAAAIERNFAIKVFPSIFFVSSAGRTEDVIAGYIPPGPLIGEVRRVKQGQFTLSALEAVVEKDPKSIAARIALAQKLDDLGDLAGHDAQMEAVRTLDPEGVSTPVRRIQYLSVVDEMEAEFDDSKNHYPTEPLLTFLDKEQNTDVQWEGWSYLANLYVRLDRNEDSRVAHTKAWKHVPDAQVLPYGYTLTQQFWTQREELKKKERRLARDVSERMQVMLAETPAVPSQSRALLEDTIACCQFMNGKVDEALAALDRAIEHDPSNAAYKQRREVFAVRR
jgi:thioredoxin-related protein